MYLDGNVTTAVVPTEEDKVDHWEQHMHVYRIILYVVGIALALLLLIGNTLVVVAVCESKKLRVKTNIIVVSVAVADLIAGILLAAEIVLVHHYWARNSTVCYAWATLRTIPLHCSLLHTGLMMADRYLAVAHPIYYMDKFTCTWIGVYVACIWIYSIFIHIIQLLINERLVCESQLLPTFQMFVLVLGHFLPVLLIGSIIYTKLFYSAVVHKRKIHATNTLTFQQFMEDTLLAKVYFYIFICTIVCWGPFFISLLTWVGTNGVQGSYIIIKVGLLCVYAASGFKFIIYAVQNHTFRLAFKKMLVNTPRSKWLRHTRGR